MLKPFFTVRLTAVMLIFLWLPTVVLAAATVPKPPTMNRVIEQIEFRDISVGDALRILTEQSNLNIIASKEAAGIHVTMFLRRVTAMGVLDAIAKTYNLWYQKDEASNIVRLYTVKEYRLEQVEFKKEETEIFTMKNAKNALDLAETIKNLFSERVLLSYGKNQTEILTDLSQRFQRFNMIDGRSTLNSGRSGTNGGGGGANGTGNNNNGGGSTNINASSGGFSGNQVGISSTGQGNNSTFSNRQIELDEQLRASTEILRKLTDPNKNAQGLMTGDIGQSSDMVDASIRHQAPIYVGVIKHQNRVLVRSRDQDAMNEIRKLFKKLDIESSMLLMEVKVLSIDLSDGYNSLFDFKVKSNSGGGLSSLGATKSIGASSAEDTVLRMANTAFDPALLATVVSNNFEARLQLLEKEGRVTQLATPMLMTTNQEVSRVFVGEERPIISGYSASATTSTATTGTATVISQPILVPNTDLRAIGTTLLLTPNINADRTVSIQLLVEQSTLSAGKGTIPVQIGNTLQDAVIDLVQERTFSGTVVAKDTTSVAVGGLIEEAANNAQRKVPILGDIPVLGFFFREDAQSRSRKELVIIIKPHIIETPAESEGVSQTLLQENSIHPSALTADNMDIYANRDHRHKGYTLEQPYKEYPQQDSFDRYHGVGNSTVNQAPPPPAPTMPAAPELVSSDRQRYLELTRYAAENVGKPSAAQRRVIGINGVRLSQLLPVSLLEDLRLTATPIASWQQNNLTVTAVALENTTRDSVRVDYQHLKGQWLASTIEHETLTSHGKTYLYLIAAQPFEQALYR